MTEAGDTPPRPDGVGAYCDYDPEAQQWVYTQEQDNNQVRRVQYWDKEGEHLYIEWRGIESGERQRMSIYLNEGHFDVDFETSLGEVRRYETNVPLTTNYPGGHASLPSFPGPKVTQIKFQLRDVDREALQFSIGDVAYFDAKERCVAADGSPAELPGFLQEEVEEEEIRDGTFVSHHDEAHERFRVVRPLQRTRWGGRILVPTHHRGRARYAQAVRPNRSAPLRSLR